MTAEASEQAAARLQGFQQMKSGDGPPGSVRFVSVFCHDERRPPGLLHHARSHNADYTTVPSLAIKDQAEFFHQLRTAGCELIVDGRHDARLFLLARKIQLVEFLRDFAATHWRLAG